MVLKSKSNAVKITFVLFMVVLIICLLHQITIFIPAYTNYRQKLYLVDELGFISGDLFDWPWYMGNYLYGIIFHLPATLLSLLVYLSTLLYCKRKKKTESNITELS